MISKTREYSILAFEVSSLFLVSLMGCTTSYIVSAKPDSLSCSYEFANFTLKDKEATIEFVGGQEIEASNVSLSPDSIRFDYSRGTKNFHVVASRIVEIDARDAGKGTIEGLGIGALTGGMTGLAILYGLRADEPSVWDAPALGYAVLGGAGAVLGGTFGALAGFSIGHSDQFTFKTAQSANLIADFPVPRDSSLLHEYVFSLRIASAFSGSDFEGGWRTSYAVRAALGKVLAKSLTVFANLDYYRFHLPPASGNSGLLPQSARRHDFALYGSVLLARVLVLGAGLYYTTSDQVNLVSPFESFIPYPWQGSGFSAVRFFSIFGLSYDIHLAEAFFVPVGLFYRTSYSINDAIPIYGTLGLGITF